MASISGQEWIPSKEELEKLPRWAAVAFAARCARRVQPILQHDKSSDKIRRVSYVDSALAAVEAVARKDVSFRGNLETSLGVGIYSERPDSPEFDFASKSVAGVATYAVYTALHASKGDDEATRISARAAAATQLQAFRELGQMVRSKLLTVSSLHLDETWPLDKLTQATRADYEFLVSTASFNNWTHDSPVDVALLGPLWPPGTEPEWAKKPQVLPEGNLDWFTEDDLKHLPRWALAAFAARCARRVLPLFHAAWPEAPANFAESNETAVAFAELAAKRGNATEPDVISLYRPMRMAIVNAFISTVAEHVAASAQQASQCAIANHVQADLLPPSGNSLASCVAASDFAYSATLGLSNTDGDTTRNRMRADLRTLSQLAKVNKWTDDSPVDVALLGPLWAQGTEPQWSTQQAGTERRGLKPVTLEEIKQLPRFARTAFGARCARRVQPLFALSVKEAQSAEIAWLEDMIRYSEAAALGGPVANSSAEAAYARVSTAAPNAVYNAAAALVCSTARLAAVSTLPSDLREKISAYVAASNAVDATFGVSPADVTTVTNGIVSDLQTLIELSKAKKWTDDSPVDVALLGPLWPPGTEPEWAKNATVASIEAAPIKGELSLNLPLPAIPDDPEIQAFVAKRLRELVLGISEAYIHLGGSGLVLKDVELHVESPAFVESPNGGGNGGGR